MNPSLASVFAAWIEAYQERGYAVTSADPSAEVIHHIAMITWPPDARYSPLAHGSMQGHQQLLQQHSAGAEEAAAALKSRGLLGSGGTGGSDAGSGGDAVAEGIVGGASNDAGAGGEAGLRQLGLVRALVFPVDKKAAESPQLWEVSHEGLAGAALVASMAGCFAWVLKLTG